MRISREEIEKGISEKLIMEHAKDYNLTFEEAKKDLIEYIYSNMNPTYDDTIINKSSNIIQMCEIKINED